MSKISKVPKTRLSPLADNLKYLVPERATASADSVSGIYFFDRKCKVRIANQPELRQKAYELLHRLYSKMGIAPSDPNGMWLSIFDALPETATLIAEDDRGELTGALTVVFDSPIGLPADALYKKEVDRIRRSDRKVCEIISLGINDRTKGSVKVLASLFYCSWLLSLHLMKSSDFVITVHERYEKFYCQNMLFRKIGEVRKYAKVNGAPTVLLNLPLMLPVKLRDKQRIFPLAMLKYSARQELEVIQKIETMLRPLSDEEFFYFFIDKTNTWEKATIIQKDYIKKIYPSHRVDHFKVSRAMAKGFSQKNEITASKNEK